MRGDVKNLSLAAFLLVLWIMSDELSKIAHGTTLAVRGEPPARMAKSSGLGRRVEVSTTGAVTCCHRNSGLGPVDTSGGGSIRTSPRTQSWPRCIGIYRNGSILLIEAQRPASLGELRAAVAEAIASRELSLIEIPVDPSVNLALVAKLRD